MTSASFSSAALDRHITGNYGEDQYKGYVDFEEFLDDCYSKCLFQQLNQCPVECACNASCLVVRAIMKDEEAAYYEMSRLQDEHYERMFLEELSETCSDLEFYDGRYVCNASSPGMGKKCSPYCHSVVR